MRPSTSSFRRSIPRSVGTSWPKSSTRSPLATNGPYRSSLEPARRHPFEDAEPEEYLLQVGVARVERFAAPDRQLPRLHALQVRLGRAHVPPAAVVAVGMRSGAEAHVRPPLPVAEVVKAPVPGPGPVRDLVVAGSRRRARSSQASWYMSACRSGSGAGRAPAATCRPERRRRLDRERVRAHVLGREHDRLAERALPRLDRLAVRPVDQIEAEIHVAAARAARECGPHRAGRCTRSSDASTQDRTIAHPSRAGRSPPPAARAARLRRRCRGSPRS